LEEAHIALEGQSVFTEHCELMQRQLNMKAPTVKIINNVINNCYPNQNPKNLVKI